MGAPPLEKSVARHLEAVLGRPLLVPEDDLAALPDRDPEAFRILQDIAKIACRLWPTPEEEAR